MNKVKIFICCHKPDTVKHDDVYIPLHVGRALSKYKEEMKDMIGDDTGENISEKNPFYSEATGIYWIWKNVHDTEYVGLCHYRRFFDCNFTNENIDGFFKDGTEVILAEKILQPHDRWHGILNYVQIEDLMILRGVIRKICPEYLPSLNSYWRDYKSNAFNMVVCKKSLYDAYAEWMFSICAEFEKYMRPSGYSNSRRVFAYITEMITPLYFYHNKCKIKEMPVVFDGKTIKSSFKSKVIYWTLNKSVWRFTKNKPVFVDSSVYRGMSIDGIDLDCNP